SDMSDASGTCWLDVGARRWSPPLLEACGLGLEQMPRLVEGTEVSGRLRSALAKRWGMDIAPVVAGGGGDNPASACGTGTVRPGSAFLSLGTSGVLFVSNARFSPNPAGGVHAFCHALPKAWHQMGVVLSATGSLDWLARMLNTEPRALLAHAAGEMRGPSPVTFLPYLSGERTPHSDASIRGAFAGLAAETERRNLVRAVLEGVAFAFRDCLEALKAAGTKVTQATAVGGGARSRPWIEIIATVLGIPIRVPAAGDVGAAFGAARLGLIAATGAEPLAVCTPPRIVATLEPRRALARAYEDRWQRYRALYPGLKEAMG
ncbi:MAG: FGGY-family carbohydrate kinase, partial [Parvibaculaceae bacterium]